MKSFVKKYRYYFCLLAGVMLAAGFSRSWGTYAKFVHEDSAQAAARVAFFAGTGFAAQDLAVDLVPGKTAEIPFSVTNDLEGKQSETTMAYQISLDTYGSIQLEYELLRDGKQMNFDAACSDFLTINDGQKGKETHHYLLKISWPLEANADFGQHDMKALRLQIVTQQAD